MPLDIKKVKDALKDHMRDQERERVVQRKLHNQIETIKQDLTDNGREGKQTKKLLRQRPEALLEKKETLERELAVQRVVLGELEKLLPQPLGADKPVAALLHPGTPMERVNEGLQVRQERLQSLEAARKVVAKQVEGEYAALGPERVGGAAVAIEGKEYVAYFQKYVQEAEQRLVSVAEKVKGYEKRADSHLSVDLDVYSGEGEGVAMVEMVNEYVEQLFVETGGGKEERTGAALVAFQKEWKEVVQEHGAAWSEKLKASWEEREKENEREKVEAVVEAWGAWKKAEQEVPDSAGKKAKKAQKDAVKANVNEKKKEFEEMVWDLQATMMHWHKGKFEQAMEYLSDSMEGEMKSDLAEMKERLREAWEKSAKAYREELVRELRDGWGKEPGTER